MNKMQDVEQCNVCQVFFACKSLPTTLHITGKTALVGDKHIFLARTNNGRGA
jgi:hypothetical protein